MNTWEHFPHSSDVGIRGKGNTLEEAFEMAAKALTSVITDLELVNPKECVAVTCDSPGPDYMLYDWLNLIIFEMDTKGMLFSKFEVSLWGTLLKGKLWGEKVDLGKHHPRVGIKGATFTELKVEEKDGQFMVQCVLDV